MTPVLIAFKKPRVFSIPNIEIIPIPNSYTDSQQLYRFINLKPILWNPYSIPVPLINRSETDTYIEIEPFFTVSLLTIDLKLIMWNPYSAPVPILNRSKTDTYTEIQPF